ncbi:class I SAM-dependent DNA methyltransferase, partial [Halorhodospira sp. 9621]|uniref:DNA methyltransferase n=1 Tax=Halorhodospira sp. 9621 TaxID=2899135 RepID=UPI0030841B06|nr:class I SAM-dependent DNA methyltransferase [Halorhodospira sp. 9621]
VEHLLNEHGEPVTIWDGTTKPSPVTGEPIPDENCRSPVYRYINPRRGEWPDSEFIVGNPPFIGNKRLRFALGDGYVEALRSVYEDAVPESADFVMYWWHIAAEKVRSRSSSRLGLITTNSLCQPFNRRVIERYVTGKNPIALRFAVPDHPWVDSADGAAVRITMTVASPGPSHGSLWRVADERHSSGEGPGVYFEVRQGLIHPDLSIGANLAAARALRANQNLSSRGVIPHGAGFMVTPEQAVELGLGSRPGAEQYIRPYRNGRDITRSPRGVMVLDPYPLSRSELKGSFPEVYQWLLDHVKPERDQNKRRTYREKWWTFAEPRKEWRRIIENVPRYLATPQTAKHRFFVNLGAEVLPDDKLIAIGLTGAEYLGILSSRIHALWALSAGSRLGVGNDPVYNKSSCFDAFPFPHLESHIEEEIRAIAERLDAHRAERQCEHPGVTLTGMYNVLEKNRAGETLTKKERTIHEQGLVTVLGELHDELDRAVFEAYGWGDLADVLVGRPGATTPRSDKPEDQEEAEQELLQRLVDLNAQRAAEEARGHVRWLRPEFQAPDEAGDQTSESSGHEADQTELATVSTTADTAGKKPTFPKNTGDRIRAVRQALAEGPQTTDSIAARYTHRPRKAVQAALEALEAIGMASHEGELWWET